MSANSKPAFPMRSIDRPPSLVSQVERMLRQSIAEGRFPGGRLPTEVALGEQLGVSRETVRLAAGVLEREGLLVKIRRRGTFVREPVVAKGAAATKPGSVVYVQTEYATGDAEESVTPTTSGLMLSGAAEEAGRAGVNLVVHRLLYTEVGRAVEQLHKEQSSGGIIFASYGEEKLLRRVAGWSVPAVLLDHSLPRTQIPSVREDSFGGARLAARHLAGLGHRRIAFINWHQTDLNPWRIQGYRQGMREGGLPRRRVWELETELTSDGARRAAKAFLRLSPRPTAVYCFNNTLAKFFIEALQAGGLRVPADVSVLGGGGEEVAGLTCHQADWRDLGRVAVQTLLRAVAGRKQTGHHLGAHSLVPGTTAIPLDPAPPASKPEKRRRN